MKLLRREKEKNELDKQNEDLEEALEKLNKPSPKLIEKLKKNLLRVLMQ